ncbi:formamidopyrimidine-DNA glycosylase [Allocatelliglobosispora scoriae]|uniref:Formamidopyrimidine-DNA glycosylase n=1 Tax=Allocatelliglobosispora scoriae TaxID=643052 RepID=A0A841BUJ9_9ACTN|nr:Fpg/Nei family DNA glycosylase [Allocatelliglobosispora scoriae]MBB5871126.1 formamidopyrimidine-DNA glycosylase [Allocatelliglobosispora scoriae]
MPELPEVEALAAYVRERAVGRQVERIDLSAISALKTFDPPLSAASGQHIRGASRRGKFLAIDLDSFKLVTHLARAGWLHYRDSMDNKLLKPGKGPIALRVHLEGGEGFDLTEAGTQKKLAVYLVTDLQQIPNVATLGPEPLDLDEAAFAAILKSQKGQIKGVLRDQRTIAGIGNAYSDEILHAAKLSPFAISSKLTEEQVSAVYEAMRSLLTDAIERSVGQKAAELKSEKRGGMRVHGRKGEPCPVCGDTVREVSFADSSLQYCPTCQTGGKPLADRRLSKLLR